MLRTVTATRYVTPLREGGSLPGLVEADDDGLYVVKFRGAGQGPRALVAEWVAGELGRASACPSRTSSAIEVGRPLGDAEPDQELQDLVHASAGLNLGPRLPARRAQPFNPAAPARVDPEIAATIVWLDALVTNPDRTVANPNLLVWHGQLWLHRPRRGAVRPPHVARSRRRTPAGRSSASPTTSCCRSPARSRTPTRARGAARRRRPSTASSRPSPTLWLPDDGLAGDADAQRAAYRRYLGRRLDAPRPFVRGGRACPTRRLARTSTPSSGSCRGSSAGSASTSASSCSAAPRRFLGARTDLDEARLAAFAPDLDPTTVQPHLDAIEPIARGEPSGGPIAQLGIAERFHWLVAPASTIIQPSAVHTGLTDDPAAELDHLYATLVG